ncbi:MAG TPA: Xaa-Pro peptidase family protein [Thermomicrobiales bacterium]|nr:Xaa-Pro peptidase family protein [Thermomicrobiales bacterium]
MATAIPTIPRSSHEDRLHRVQQRLAEEGLDWLFLGPSADLFYLTGFDAHVSERLNLLMVPRSGDPTLIVPLLESPNVGEAGQLVSMVTWEDHESPIAAAANVAGSGASGIAVGNHLYSAFLLRLQDAIGADRWVEASPLMRDLRMAKDVVEIELMEIAGRNNDVAWEQFIAAGPISGLTERQALARLLDLTMAQGTGSCWGICASGPNAAAPHYSGSDRVIQPGDSVIFDWGGPIGGYYSDVTRTVHVGEPEEEFRQVYDIVLQANQATLDAVKPGVPCQELDRAARKLITDAGYGEAFLHRVGHGLGLEVHEEPYLVEGNDLALAEGFVFSDEPGIYLEGRFGVRIEDAVVCTADGGRRLNESTRELVVME